MTSGPWCTRWWCCSWAQGGAMSTRSRSGSTRRTGSARAVSTATRCWGWLPRWNACWRHRTRSWPRGNRCWTTRTPGSARWPVCSSARCGSCTARVRGTRTRISRRHSPSSARSANGGEFRSPLPSWRTGSPCAVSSPARASTTNRRSRSSPKSVPSRTSSSCGRDRRSCTGC